MDWAEELKMSIRKTTARKGRRAKSRDLLKDNNTTASSSTGSGATISTASAGATANANNMNKEISVDITLDLQQNSTGAGSTTTASPPTTSGTITDSDGKRPPRRISGGWADSGGLKSLKSKKNSFEDERFQFSSPKLTSSPPEDDIPIIPDLDDVKDEILMNEIVEPPSVSVNRVVTLNELNSDLLSQNAFSAIEDVDLSILTRCLQAQDSLEEADDVWEWEKLFTDVIAEIHSDKTNIGVVTNEMGKIEIAADEIIPPSMHT